MDNVIKCLNKAGDFWSAAKLHELASSLDTSVLNTPVNKLKNVTPLIYAIQNADYDNVEALLKIENVDVNRAVSSQSPLLHAVQSGRAELVQLLINNNKLRKELDFSLAKAAAQQEDAQVFKNLVKRMQFDERSFVDIGKTNQTVLHVAVSENNEELVRYMLSELKGKLDVNARETENGFTAIAMAVEGKFAAVGLYW